MSNKVLITDTILRDAHHFRNLAHHFSYEQAAYRTDYKRKKPDSNNFKGLNTEENLRNGAYASAFR